MRFIGDMHCDFTTYEKLVGDAPASIQVGDFGLGFGKDYGVDDSPRLGPTQRFIRGNHDNPEMCYAHPNYIGDIAVEGSMFFMSGAFSIDRYRRTVGRDWWDNEELSYQSLMTAIDIFEQVKPRIVVTHDCPETVARVIFKNREARPSATARALDTMFQLHKPDLWVFGHWHTNIRQVVLGTRFVCVANGDALDMDISWAETS
jgi:hypothetical protein